MITLPVTPSNDNKACFVYRIISNEEFWISDAEIPITLSGFSIDANAIVYGTNGSIQNLSASLLNGGTFDISGNIGLTITASSNSLTTSFFNGFYPNGTSLLQGSLVYAYIWWTDKSIDALNDYENLLKNRIFFGKILEYKYDVSIYLTIETNHIFLNNEIPIYKTQNVIDNGISYINITEDEDTENLLDVPIPLLYGEYTAKAKVDNMNNNLYYLKDSGAPLIKMDEYGLTHKVCSHLTVSNNNTISQNENTPILYEDNIDLNYQVCTVDNLTSALTNTTTYDTSNSGSIFIFKRDSVNNLFFTGDLFFMLNTGLKDVVTITHSSQNYVVIEITTGTALEQSNYSMVNSIFTPILVELEEACILAFKKNIDICSDYPMYQLNTTSSIKGTAILEIDVKNMSVDPQYLHIYFFDYRVPLTKVYISPLGSTVSVHSFTGSERRLLEIDISSYYSSILMTESNIANASVSILDLGIGILNATVDHTNGGSFTIYNANIRIFRALLGGEPTRGKLKDKRLMNGFIGNDITTMKWGERHIRTIQESHPSLVDAKFKNDLFAYTKGRIGLQYYDMGSTGWIDNGRSNGRVYSDLIENPAYVIESLLREEAQKLVDLQATDTYADATTHIFYIYIEDLPYNNIEGYYIDSVIGFTNIEGMTDIEFQVVSHTTHASIGGGNNVLGLRNTSDILSSITIDNSIFYINNINMIIHTDSFDEIGNTTNGLLKDWKIRTSISGTSDTESFIKDICNEAFLLLFYSADGYKLNYIYDNNIVGTFTTPIVVNGDAQIALELSNLTDVYNKIILNYDYNPITNGYRKSLTRDRHNSDDCAYAYSTFKINNTLIKNSKYHYDELSALSYLNQLVNWHTTLHSIVTYVGDVKNHIKYEIGDKVKINYPNKIPTALNNSATFMIIGKEIVQFPVPMITFTLIDVPEYIPTLNPSDITDLDVWYKADITIVQTTGNVTWTDSIAPSSLRMIQTGATLGGTLYDVNKLTVLNSGDTNNTNLLVVEGSSFYNPFHLKTSFTTVHIVKPKDSIHSVWCGGVWDLTGETKAFWGIRWGFDANGRFVVHTKYLAEGTSYYFTSTKSAVVNNIEILMFQYEESTKTFSIIYKGEKIDTTIPTWPVVGGYPQLALTLNNYYNQTGTPSFSIDTLDLLVYDRIIDTTEINGIGLYMSNRWSTIWNVI